MPELTQAQLLSANLRDEIERVDTAIRQADAEDGPTAGADIRKLAQYRDSLVQKQNAQHSTLTRQAEVQDRDARFRRSAKGLVTEAFPRLVEGYQQLVAMARELGGSEGAVAEQAADMNVRRLAASGGDEDFEEGADVGEALLLMAPAGMATRAGAVRAGVGRALPEAQTMARAIARTGKDALIAGGLASGASETAETAGDVAFQKAASAGLAFLPGSILQLGAGGGPAIKNFVGRLAARAQENRALQAARANMGPSSMPDPVSLQTGSKMAQAIERQVQMTKAQNYFNDLFEDFADHLEPMVNAMGRVAVRANVAARRGGAGDSHEVAMRVNKAWQADVRKTQQAASSLYGQRLSSAVRVAADDPVKFPIRFDRMGAAVGKWSDEATGPWWRKVAPGAERPTGVIKELDDYLTAVRTTGAHPTIAVPELIRIRANLRALDQQYWTEARNMTHAMDQATANKHRALNDMIQAVDDDIDAFLAVNKASSPGATPRPAVQALTELREANRDYKAFKDARQEMFDRATVKLFGHEGNLPIDQSKALADIAKMEPGEQRFLANLLRQHDPAALADLRFTLLNNAFTELTSGAGRAATRGKVDPGVWESAILGNNKMAFGEGLFTPAEYARLNQSLNRVRVLRSGTEGQVDPNTAPSAESTLMALVSRSGAFLGRAFFRIGGAGKLEDLLLTDKGLRSLQVMEDVYKGRRKVTDPLVRNAVQDFVALTTNPELEENRGTGE